VNSTIHKSVMTTSILYADPHAKRDQEVFVADFAMEEGEEILGGPNTVVMSKAEEEKEGVVSACPSCSARCVLNKGQFWFLLIAGACSFWPMLLPEPAYLRSTPLKKTILDADTSHSAAIVLLILLIPLVLDLFLDTCHMAIASNKKHATGSFSILTKREKLLMYLGFACVPLVIILPATPSEVLLFLCMTRFQMVAVFGTIWISLGRLNRGRWPRWTLYVGISLWVVGLHIGLQVYITGVFQGYLLNLSKALTFIGVYGFFAIPALWFLATGIRKHISKLPVFPIVYTTIGTLTVLASFVILNVLGGFINFNESDMLIYISVMIVLEVGIIMLHMRKDKIRTVMDNLLAEWAEERSVQTSQARLSSLHTRDHRGTEEGESQLEHETLPLPLYQESEDQQPSRPRLQVVVSKWSVSDLEMRRLRPGEHLKTKYADQQSSDWYNETLATSAVGRPSILGRVSELGQKLGVDISSSDGARARREEEYKEMWERSHRRQPQHQLPQPVQRRTQHRPQQQRAVPSKWSVSDSLTAGTEDWKLRQHTELSPTERWELRRAELEAAMQWSVTVTSLRRSSSEGQINTKKSN
jgi:hypothetical protein